jgi:hypothetical protein
MQHTEDIDIAKERLLQAVTALTLVCGSAEECGPLLGLLNLGDASTTDLVLVTEAILFETNRLASEFALSDEELR